MKLIREEINEAQYIVEADENGKKSNKIKFQTNSYMNDTIVTLNHFTNNDTWKLTAHAIVNFSAIFFTVNWLYYRSIRIKMEKKDKGDE